MRVRLRAGGHYHCRDGSAGYAGDGGLALAAQIRDPQGIAYDGNGNIYFADNLNFVVRMIDAATGVISTVAGNGTQGFSGDGGFATLAQLGSPVGIFATPEGHLYIADQSNQRVRFVSGVSGVIGPIAGNGLTGFAGDGGLATSARLNNPQGVVLDLLGDPIIADTLNFRVRKLDYFNGTGIITTIAGTGFPASTGDGNLATAAGLSSPRRVAIDSLDNIYILDRGSNARIRRIDASTGIITTVAGGGMTVATSGIATDLDLGPLTDLAVDENGALILTASFRVWKVEAGMATVIAGTGSSGSSGDGGDPLAATFNNISGVAVNAAGELLVSDRSNHRIRKITLTAPPACPADFNHVNGVTVQDIFDFLGAWFAACITVGPGTCQYGSADFNGVNGVSVQDIFSFLSAWFANCP